MRVVPSFGTEDDALYFNGVNGVTGQYLIPPTSAAQIAEIIKDQPKDPNRQALARMATLANQSHLGLPLDLDANDLAQAGWGIVFHVDVRQDIRDALEPLIEHRRSQVRNDKLVKILDYKSGEGRAQWLARFRVAAGEVNPIRVPYYLLLVGPPSEIPFTFGFLLDTDYAVGRIAFETAEGYSAYARSVVQYELKENPPSNAKEVVFFASRHPMDGATQLSADQLVVPLADGYIQDGECHSSTPLKYGFQRRKIVGEDATKSALLDVIRAADAKTPAILFSATHGMAGWPSGDPRQSTTQGALLCQDWPGLGKIDQAHYFSAADLPGDAKIYGLVAFLFGCYSIGTPQFDRFFHMQNAPPPEIAKSAFFSHLAQKMLTHPNGGALACIGHVERAWGSSIAPRGVGPRLLPFENLLGSLMKGRPVGQALQGFNEIFAVLSAALSSLLEDIGFGATIDDRELARSWVERNDAEGYVIFGDPAVRLRVDDLT